MFYILGKFIFNRTIYKTAITAEICFHLYKYLKIKMKWNEMKMSYLRYDQDKILILLKVEVFRHF